MVFEEEELVMVTLRWLYYFYPAADALADLFENLESQSLSLG